MAYGTLCVLVVALAGHAALAIGLLNRAFGYRMPCPALKLVSRVHAVAIVGVPAWFLWSVGLGESGLLTSGDWSKAPAGWLLYLSVCGVVAVATVVTVWTRSTAAIPAAQISNHSATVNVAERLGRRPIGRGTHRLLARLPGNEQFLVEVSDKQYRLPRLPQAWDGLSVLHLSDLHFHGTIDKAYFEQVVALSQELQPDLVAFTGDLLDRDDLIEWIPDTLGRLEAPLGCYFILGNHDWFLGNTEPTRALLADLGWQDVAGQTLALRHKDHDLVIAGTEQPWMGAHPAFDDTPEDAFRLLLSHTPDHIGLARRCGIDLMLAGHNHGGQVRLPGIGPIYAPSRYGCRFAAGAFWRASVSDHEGGDDVLPRSCSFRIGDPGRR